MLYINGKICFTDGAVNVNRSDLLFKAQHSVAVRAFSVSVGVAIPYAVFKLQKLFF